MNHNICNRAWSILSWNIRGINSQTKWDHLRNKIVESSASIVCLQETMREIFDQAFLSNFCPRHLNESTYVPPVGASGGLLVCWNGNSFQGDVIHVSGYAITLKFTSLPLAAHFHLSNVYGRCVSTEKAAFINWCRAYSPSTHARKDEDRLLLEFPCNRTRTCTV
jgi:hypothetical protein